MSWSCPSRERTGTWPPCNFALNSAAMASCRTALAALVTGLAACSDPGASSSGFTTPGMTTRPDETSAGDSTSTSGSTSSTSSTSTSTGSGSADGSTGPSSTTNAAFPDMGTPQPDFGGPPIGCKGKIDFLFVISRAGVMGPAQDKLVAAAPDFLTTIQAQFDDFDVHIMVVDSQEAWWVDNCEDQCPAPCDKAPDYPCGVVPTVCDTTMGAGTVYNAGPYAANVPCDLGGRRYITKDTPDIPSAFECIARVGVSGNNLMGDALLAAVGPELNASEPEPGGCNAGFLRDDALLVLTMIGPEDNIIGGSQGKWQEWRQAVVDAKHGDLNSIVALGIVNGPDCKADMNPDHRLCNFIPSFPNSVLGHLTLENYGAAFEKAALLALDACSVFVPG